MLDEFDTLRQHAEWLKKSPRTVQRWIARPNGLPYARAGKELLFKPRWTLEWLESLKT
jgi:hypothetical protein